MGTYTYPKFPYTAPADLMTGAPQRRPLIIVGAGPVGLAAAIDARLKGLPVLVFDDDDTVSIGSRAVCYAKRALEVLDRLGVGDPLCDKGVSWNVGRTFVEEDEVYQFNLVPEAGHKRPGMINLQQYYLEEMMIARALALGADVRWQHKVISVQPQDGITRGEGLTASVDYPIPPTFRYRTQQASKVLKISKRYGLVSHVCPRQVLQKLTYQKLVYLVSFGRNMM